MKTTTREAVQIPITPSKGEVWFSINLGLIEDVSALYALLYALKFDTKLAWIRSKTGIEVGTGALAAVGYVWPFF